MADDPLKDECAVCTWVLIAAGLAVAGVLAFMAADLALDGRLSGGLTKAVRLAPVADLRSDDDAAG
jgi:hypothetical protein